MFCCSTPNLTSPLSPPRVRYEASSRSILSRKEPIIEAVVLTAETNDPLIPTIKLAFESFVGASLHTHHFPTNGQDPHLDILDEESHVRRKPNMVFLVETNGPQNTLLVAKNIRRQTEQDPVPIIYVSKEGLKTPDPMNEIDEQMVHPEQPCLGEVFRVAQIVAARFPNAERQHAHTSFGPPHHHRLEESAL